MAKKRIERIPMSFQEIPFPYDDKEYELWKTGDKKVRDSILNVSGYLGQDKGVYYNKQFDQHYPEVKYAAYLVEDEDNAFRPRCIRYEKFRLSNKFITNQLEKIATKPFKDTMDAKRYVDGHDLLCGVFKEKFFEEFDSLCDLNAAIIQPTRKDIYGTCVDLCAINHEKRQVRFSEMKKISPDKRDHEGFKKTFHQLYCLGFIRHIIDSLRKKVFIGEPYEVITEIVVLVPKQRYSELVNRLEPRRVEFYIDKNK